MVTKLIIEGTADTKNGDLRKGFNKLLSQKLSGKMPRIVMAEGKSQAINKFVNSSDSFLLCDLDGPEDTRQTDISNNKLNQFQEDVYYMVQEMEAWFISQPGILDKFYSADISKKIPAKPAIDFPNPDEKLQEWTKGIERKGAYHKVKHGAILLEMLDANKLMTDFDDFRNLIEALLKKS